MSSRRPAGAPRRRAALALVEFASRSTPATPVAARHLISKLVVGLVIMPPEIERSRATNRILPEGYGRDLVSTPRTRFLISKLW
jgi:hypothetical protein